MVVRLWCFFQDWGNNRGARPRRRYDGTGARLAFSGGAGFDPGDDLGGGFARDDEGLDFGRHFGGVRSSGERMVMLNFEIGVLNCRRGEKGCRDRATQVLLPGLVV